MTALRLARRPLARLVLLASCAACRKADPTSTAPAPPDGASPAASAAASATTPPGPLTIESLPSDSRRPKVAVGRFVPTEESVDDGGLDIEGTAFPAVAVDGTVALFADIHSDTR